VNDETCAAFVVLEDRKLCSVFAHVEIVFNFCFGPSSVEYSNLVLFRAKFGLHC
jgi:hypothetical protein